MDGIVSDSALTTRINAVRRAGGDNGCEQRLIRTLRRRGFRFIGEVSEPAVAQQAAIFEALPGAKAGVLAARLADEASIAYFRSPLSALTRKSDGLQMVWSRMSLWR